MDTHEQQQAKSFLQALWRQKSQNSFILIWTLPGKLSYWSTDVETAARYATAQTGKNVYVGAALSPKNFGPDERCLAERTAGIGGLWMDIDILDPAHKKQNLPPTIEDARLLLTDCGLAPSAVIHSGHGLQAWWFFQEIWMFGTPEERTRAARLTEKWKIHFRQLAKTRGWDADATHDLARVMRMPGTFNQNGTPVVPVQILALEPEIRYTVEDIEEFVAELNIAEVNLNSTRRLTGDGNPTRRGKAGFILNPSATPPFDKWEALKEAEPKARLSWERKRKDIQDTSSSGYDMSLANIAMQAGWNDQEIVDLLVASNRKHGGTLKRESYYALTLDKARAHEVVFSESNDDEDEPGAASTSSDPWNNASKGDATGPASKEKEKNKKKELSQVLGVEMVRIIKYLSDPPSYTIETGGGQVRLGPVTNLIGQAQLRNKLADASKVHIKNFKSGEWHKIAQSLLDLCEDQDPGQEATERGVAHEWLREYFHQQPEPREMDQDAIEAQLPFLKGGQRCFFFTHFFKMLRIQGEHIDRREVSLILKAYGCEPDKITLTVDGKRTSRGIWTVPNDNSSGE